MRKTLLSALVAGAFAFGASAQAGPLTFDLDGNGPANVITALSLDWSPTSFLALNGVRAIRNFDAGLGGPVDFDVLTHAKLTGYVDAFGVSRSLPGSFTGEITVVSRFTEMVTGTTANGASFMTTGAGWVEMYYSATANSNNLRGSNFNDGRVIMRAENVADAFGNFTVTSATPTALDGSGTDDYKVNGSPAAAGQKSVSGFGSQGEIVFNDILGVDTNFLKTAKLDFSILFENISIGLPYKSVDPSDCFNPLQVARTAAQIDGGVTNNALLTQCNSVNHIDDTYAVNKAAHGNDGGYVPVVGPTNGLFAPGVNDFVAQTDYNSAVTGTVPEPGMLALLGLAFAGLGLTTARRRRT